MPSELKSFIVPTKDLAQAKALYSAIWGVAPVMDEPYYVGFKVGDLDVGLDPNGHSQGMTGPVAYWQVDDIRASLKALLDGGAEAVRAVSDVGGGRQIASVKDTDGNMIGLLQDS